MRFSPANKLFIVSHVQFTLALFLWFTEPFHHLLREGEIEIFYLLNQTLNTKFMQHFWGILNHRSEGSINLILAGIISIIAVIKTPENKRYTTILQTIYFWILFQFGFMLQNWLAVEYFQFVRHSPSLVLDNVNMLSQLLHNSRIKDFSFNSFPGGHAFAMIYWGAFMYIIAPKRIGQLSLALACFFCLPRLFSGAHWVSDVVFSAMLALIWLSLSINIPCYSFLLKFAERNNKIVNKYRVSH